MTGPEHYREAERLMAGHPVTAAERADGVQGERWPPSVMHIRAAQVHATLALAAATADLFAFTGRTTDDAMKAAWREVTS